MMASELKAHVNRIRDAHRAEKHDPLGCDVCMLLIGIDTAVARHWDPVSGRPFCSHGHKKKVRHGT